MDREMKIKAVIFDMDGTILDTLEDLADSVNVILERNGFPRRSRDEVRWFVGNGIHKLTERAVPSETAPSIIEEIYDEFLMYYKDHCRDKTRPYPGIPELIGELRRAGYKTAVISNKSDNAVKELDNRFFEGCFDIALGAREEMRIKPDREMTDLCLKELGVSAEEAIYVGDSDVDIETAKNAEMKCISVTWGFRDREFLVSHGAEILIDRPEELLNVLEA